MRPSPSREVVRKDTLTGLPAVCQSSEMQALSLDERVALARFTMDHVKGRIPVVASGHISDSRDDQLAELTAMAGSMLSRRSAQILRGSV